METKQAPADIAAKTAKPRARPVGTGYAVTYRGEVLSVRPVWDSRKEGTIAWWTVEGSCGTDDIDRPNFAESAVGQWTRNLDDAAQLARQGARKAGKTVTIETDGLSVDVTPNRSIRIHGERYGKAVDLTYAIGATAEYDSYNLHYFGEIVSITARTVTIRPRNERRTRRLPIASFAWRNATPVDEKARRNSEWMD